MSIFKVLPLEVEAKYFVELLLNNSTSSQVNHDQLASLALIGLKKVSDAGNVPWITFNPEWEYPVA